MSTNLRLAAGSLLVVGLSGHELNGLERAWLKLIRPSGIILFRRNIETPSQTRALLAEATAYSEPANLRCVDIEGGTVDRLRDAVAPMPSAQSVSQTANTRLMERQGELIAKEAQAFGFNTTLAPVLDLALPDSAEVMGTRTSAREPNRVITYTRSFFAGLASRGLTGCAKHFPGLGGGTLDSHHATPAIQRTWTELWQQDLAPYRTMFTELPMVMVNHATYPQTRGGNLPATVSPFWITAILQRRIGYRGLVFSDDMEMGGILKSMPVEEAAVASVRAGMHLMEVCHNPELIIRCYESLIREAEQSTAFGRILLERARVGRTLRFNRFSQPTSRALSAKQLTSLRNEILRFTAEVETAQPGRRAE